MNGDVPNSIAALADALLAHNDDDIIDFLDVVDLLRPLLAPAVHFDLCVAVGLCPMHGCDQQTCADDVRRECGGGVGYPTWDVETTHSECDACEAAAVEAITTANFTGSTAVEYEDGAHVARVQRIGGAR